MLAREKNWYSAVKLYPYLSSMVASSASPHAGFFQRASADLPVRVRTILARAGTGWSPRQVVLKPNWVIHETDPAFPISALVTDSRLIEATAQACLELFPSIEQLWIADCPLQSANWELLCRQAGIDQMRERLTSRWGDRVRVADFRREVAFQKEGTFLQSSFSPQADPKGYREIELGKSSHLEALASQAERFAVNDYNAAITRSNHSAGSHRYLVSQTILNSDLFINLPKWKTHQKSGITAGLKNVVGINGDKAYLPHFRRGAPKWGGDEYQDENRWLYWIQTQCREKLQKRSQLGFRLLKPGWELLKKWKGIETRYASPRQKKMKFYVAGGAWHGNETIWRMIYDLNLIIQCADAAGKLQASPQRDYFCLVDGLICGEGNGPLQPLPREMDWLGYGNDPFLIDTALAWWMGFDPGKIPLLRERSQYQGPHWGRFEKDHLPADLDGQPINVFQSALNFRFEPPPGWRGQIERNPTTIERLSPAA